MRQPVITSLDNPRVKEVLRLRKARERRRDGLFVAEGRREVERALAAGLVVRERLRRARACSPTGAPRGEEVSARVLAQDGLPRRARRRARRLRDPAAHAPRRRDAAPRRRRDREAGQPRRDGAHRRRRGRRRAPRRRRRTSTRGTRTRFARRPAPSSRCRSSRRRATRSPRCRSRRSPRCSAPRRATPTPTTRKPTAFLVGAEDDGLERRLARARRRRGRDPDAAERRRTR